jgi:hypothetical protein
MVYKVMSFFLYLAIIMPFLYHDVELYYNWFKLL